MYIHTYIHVSSYCYMCVLMLLYMCPHTADAAGARAAAMCRSSKSCSKTSEFASVTSRATLPRGTGCSRSTAERELLWAFSVPGA